ncbi:hypothetical protein BDN70DRAFT_106163 [Pholiota conissans]|uniref:FHA domain-containing protein n=1 Tax=Pholiota conissans TaxID=109636 RepID=A0A9P6CXX3_9AGAR|nr:hypothetical protein BDN70DRAFT_106163 [Pholiota conissans]
MDDDIVFLGSSPANIPIPSSRPAQRPVTGVSLHVEKNGSIDAHCLTFRRTDSTVVHIGRRPAMDPAIDDNQSTAAASFRCAVVSRRHAKIAFSDSGHVYLIDLGSHHGTHVRSQGVARALKPETPTLLVDGDVITFGKAVGKGDECVQPIITRIELLLDPNTSTTFRTLSLPSSSPSSKGSSGRYGIHTSSSSSDESAENGEYSDIEEIPPPLESAPSSNQSSQPASQPSQTSCAPIPSLRFGHFTALKRFLPPMDIATPPWHVDHSYLHMTRQHPHEQSSPAVALSDLLASRNSLTLPSIRLPPPSAPSFVGRPFAQLAQMFRATGETTNAPDRNNAPSNDGAPEAPANGETAVEAGTSVPANADSILPAEVSPSPLLPSPEFNGPYDLMMPSEDQHALSSSYMRRCNIMFASPPYLSHGLPMLDEHSDSESDSDFSSSSSRNSERDERERERGQEKERESSEPMDLSSRNSSPAPVVRSVDKGKARAADIRDESDADEGGEKDMDIENEHPADWDAMRKHLGKGVERATQTALARIEDAVARLEADFTIHRGQTKATLARHTNQMDVFDGRIREVDAECGVLCVRVETLGERISAMEVDATTSAEENTNAAEIEAEKDRAAEEARSESVDAVRALIAEAHDELYALKALRAEAEAYAARQKEQERVQAQPPPVQPPSLKRKRDDSDEDASEAAPGSGSEDDLVSSEKAAGRADAAETENENEKDADVVMDAVPPLVTSSTSGIDSCAGVTTTSTPSSPATTLVDRDAMPPPRKRARRIVGLMARTATAVGVGAVVTWTALAFS